MRTALIILCVLVTSALADGKKPLPTQYFEGPVTFSSADGKTPMGKGSSLVKRTVGENQVVETVTQPGRKPGDPAHEYTTTMTRRGKTLVFDATDDGKTFTGTLTYASDKLDSWTYDIQMTAGGSIKGKGRIDAKGVHTEKEVVMRAGPSMKVVEELAPVTEATYTQHHQKLVKP